MTYIALSLVLLCGFAGAQEGSQGAQIAFPIGLAYPMSWPTGEPRRNVPPYLAAYHLAIKHLNEDLPYNFTALPVCNTKHSILEGYGCAVSLHSHSPLGIAGASYSSVSLHMVVITTQHMVLQCSGSSTSPDLSNRDYKYFFRTVAPDDARAEGIVRIMYHFEWHRAVVIHTTDRFGAGLAEKLGRARPGLTPPLELKFLGVEPDFYRVLDQTQLNSLAFSLTHAIRSSLMRIIIPVLLYNNINMLVQWCSRRELIRPGYVWIGIDAFEMFVAEDILQRMDNTSDIYPNRANFVDFMWITAKRETTNRTARLMADTRTYFGLDEPGSYSNQFYDCITAFGLAADMVLRTNRTLTPSMLVQGDVHVKNQLRDAAFSLEFEGASGFVQFKKPNTPGAGDRKPIFSILRWRIEAVWDEVGFYTELGEEPGLVFTKSANFSTGAQPLPHSWEGCGPGQEHDPDQSFVLNQDVCVPCPVGQFKRSTSRDGCSPCIAGHRCEEANGTTVPEPCEAGNFSHEGNGTCSECPPGTYSDSKGSSRCTVCQRGFFQELSSATKCNACEQGRFQSETGTTVCENCTDQRSTQNSGTPTGDGCGCPVGTRWVDETWQCEGCDTGMTCSRFNETPQVARGYYLEKDKPRNLRKMDLFKCNVERWCPGEEMLGDPMCATKREGLSCGMCAHGYYESGLDCDECTDTHTLYYISLVLGALLLCGLLAHFWANKSDHVEVSEGLLFSLTAGTTLAVVQKLGVVGRIGVAWPEGIGEVLRWCSTIFVKFVVLTPSCLFPPSLFTMYLARLFTPMFTVFGCSVWWGLSNFLHRYISPRFPALSIYQVINTMGLLLSALYIYAAIGTFSLVDCYQNPNGKRTIREFSFSLCSGPEFMSALPLFILGVAIYIVGLVTMTLYALWVAPTRYSRASGFRVMIHFLVYKFRPNKYWFGIVSFLGQFLMALTPVVFPDSPVMQFLSLKVIVGTLLIHHWVHMPYSQGFANVVEAAEYLGLLVLLSLGTFFLDPLDSDGKTNASIAMVVIVAVMGILVLGAFGWGVFLAVFRRRAAERQEALLARQVDAILSGCEQVVQDKERFRELMSREASYVERDSAENLMRFFQKALSGDAASVRRNRRLFLSLRAQKVEAFVRPTSESWNPMAFWRSFSIGKSWRGWRGHSGSVVDKGQEDAQTRTQHQGDPPGCLAGAADVGFFLGPSNIIKITM